MNCRAVLCEILNSRNQFAHLDVKYFIKNLFICQGRFKWYHTSQVNFKARVRAKEQQKIDVLLKKKSNPPLEIWEPMTVNEVCNIFKCNKDIIKMSLPNFDVQNDLYRKEIIQLAKKLHKKCVFVSNPYKPVIQKSEKEILVRQPPPKQENLVKRPPVVTVMGHVDHGKTTLLDSLRNTYVVDSEFGGITQHIGAFLVQLKSGDKITFIDTPGHAAFTTLRSRGAEVTDLIVLVIAADDGIMEQTIESIRIANRAQVKMIIAVNKIDKPNTLSIDVIKDKLLLEGIQVEDKGGDVQIIPISALKKINLDLLLEMILVEAELMNLKGDPFGLMEGVIIESKMHKQGPATTLIVKRGMVKKGIILVSQKAHCRVRLLLDENGKECEEASLSTPIQIFGWKELPDAGDEVFEVKSEKIASQIVKSFKKKATMEKQKEDLVLIEKKAEEHQKKIRLTNLHYKSLTTPQERKKFVIEQRENERKDVMESTGPSLKLIIKGDVHGTVQVLLEILNSYDKNDECKLDIIHASVGEINQNDINLCETFNGIIYAFNVQLNSNIKDLVKEKKVDIRMHNIIYKMIDDLKSELTSRLPLKDSEKVIGEAIVNQNFYISLKNKKVPVAGCKCVKGELGKNNFYRVVRNEEIIYEGKLLSMKHHKNEVNSIKTDTECGLMFDSFSGEFQPSDKIICYEIVQVVQKSSWDPGF